MKLHQYTRINKQGVFLDRMFDIFISSEENNAKETMICVNMR